MKKRYFLDRFNYRYGQSSLYIVYNVVYIVVYSIQRQAGIFKYISVRCTTSEPFYSVKISVARATLTTSIDRGKTLVFYLFKNASWALYTMHNDVMRMKV